jgi:hypothetical protein
MDLQTAKRQKENGKLVKWRNKCWYIRSLDEARKEVSLDDRRPAFIGTIITASHVPISELRCAYQRRKTTDKQKA